METCGGPRTRFVLRNWCWCWRCRIRLRQASMPSRRVLRLTSSPHNCGFNAQLMWMPLYGANVQLRHCPVDRIAGEVKSKEAIGPPAYLHANDIDTLAYTPRPPQEPPEVSLTTTPCTCIRRADKPQHLLMSAEPKRQHFEHHTWIHNIDHCHWSIV